MRVRPPKRPAARLREPHESLSQLEWTTARRYVELLRERGDLLVAGRLDLDLTQLVDRRFECDCRKCIVWRRGEALVDGSCCARYRVELTRADRLRLLAILPRVRARLPEEHALRNPDELPFVVDEDYRHVMAEDERGVCPFVGYTAGRSECAIHRTCLEEGLDVWAYKPLSCSMWPLATIDYPVNGRSRTLVTAYAAQTRALFADDRDELDNCACLVDRDAHYPPLYVAQREVLAHVFGEALCRRLDAAARRRRRGRDGR